MESVSASYSLQANKLCLILACASLLFLPSQVVAAFSTSVSLDVDRPGDSGLAHSEFVDATISRADSSVAGGIVVRENERPQSLQPLLRMGARKHSIYLIKAGRRLLVHSVPAVQSPPSPVDPTQPGPGQNNIAVLPSPAPL